MIRGLRQKLAPASPNYDQLVNPPTVSDPGGIRGVVVTTPVPDGRIRLGAQIVQMIVDKGFIATHGHDPWISLAQRAYPWATRENAFETTKMWVWNMSSDRINWYLAGATLNGFPITSSPSPTDKQSELGAERLPPKW